MKITSIRKSYIQKSKLFLYPLLGIKRGVSVTPVQTYMAWKDVYTINDCKLIAVYHLRDDAQFKEFEENKLLGNAMFEEFFELDNDDAAYVFDFSEFKREYKRIVHGKYSMLDEGWKRKILNFFKNHQGHQRLIESYLRPDLYYSDYSELLNVNESLLEEVGELCSLPDLDEEMLNVKKKVLNFESINNL